MDANSAALKRKRALTIDIEAVEAAEVSWNGIDHVESDDESDHDMLIQMEADIAIAWGMDEEEDEETKKAAKFWEAQQAIAINNEGTTSLANPSAKQKSKAPSLHTSMCVY